MLSDAEIIRRLKIIRHSPAKDRIAGRSISISDIARASGVSKMHLYCIIKGSYQLGPKSRAAISHTFECKDEQEARIRARPDPMEPAARGR